VGGSGGDEDGLGGEEGVDGVQAGGTHGIAGF
jgi:hypothetical protein